MDSLESIPIFVQFLTSLGVGGVLAWFMFKQNDSNLKRNALDNQSLQQVHAETLKYYHELEKGRTEMLIGVVIDNTKQTVSNTEVLKSLHKRLDKDAQERA